MRKTETVPVHTERVEVVEIVCDLCGKEAPDPNSEDGSPWSGTGDIANTTIEMETGWNFEIDKSGKVEVVTFDICPECFRTKLIPFFAEEGGRLPLVRTLGA
jgi:hypothetical protein